jgi:uncharacterized RDD family membrane protein YckC
VLLCEIWSLRLYKSTLIARLFWPQFVHIKMIAGALRFLPRAARTNRPHWPSTMFSTTPSLRRRWLRGLLGQGDAASTQTSLLKQEGIPPELRLPLPGDPMSRLGAGLVDLIIAGTSGACLGAVTQALGGDADIYAFVGQSASLATWILRDALSPDGNRSIGKRLFKLELAHWDGSLPSIVSAAARNAYFLALPLSQVHPMLEMVWTLVLVFDISSIFFTQDARKLGDYILGTRVVDERAGRADRLKDQDELAEMAVLEAELRELSPAVGNSTSASSASGSAASSSGTPQQSRWLDSVRREVLPSSVLPTSAVDPAAAIAVTLKPDLSALETERVSAAAANPTVVPVSESQRSDPVTAAPRLLVHPPRYKKKP